METKSANTSAVLYLIATVQSDALEESSSLSYPEVQGKVICRDEGPVKEYSKSPAWRTESCKSARVKCHRIWQLLELRSLCLFRLHGYQPKCISISYQDSNKFSSGLRCVPFVLLYARYCTLLLIRKSMSVEMGECTKRRPIEWVAGLDEIDCEGTNCNDSISYGTNIVLRSKHYE